LVDDEDFVEEVERTEEVEVERTEEVEVERAEELEREETLLLPPVGGA